MTDPFAVLRAYETTVVDAETEYHIFEPVRRTAIAPEAIAALRAVLTIHQPVPEVSNPWCMECTDEYVANYPCPTVRAITEALDGDR